MEDLSTSLGEPSLYTKDLNHKIRTTLAVIQGSAELLESYGQTMSQEERYELFSDIYGAVAQIAAALPEDPSHQET